MSMFGDRDKMKAEPTIDDMNFKYEICDKVLLKNGKNGTVETKISMYCRRYYDVLIEGNKMERVIETDISNKV